ncbi:hypothetical protein JB92DRAFT_2870141 [Gautieria morchelliformis]|nr:hypothetical protein JB92DRAFT_2870141 [Gautieria morchelliformis]
MKPASSKLHHPNTLSLASKLLAVSWALLAVSWAVSLSCRNFIPNTVRAFVVSSNTGCTALFPALGVPLGRAASTASEAVPS